MKQLVLIFFLVCTVYGFGQTQMSATGKPFEVKGSVKDFDNRRPISGIEVSVMGKGVPVYTDEAGNFRIRVRVGDELVIKGLDIMPVYYTIQNEERIDVLVEGFYQPKTEEEVLTLHKQFIDSAKFYKTKSIEKSLHNIEKSLRVLNSKSNATERAVSMELLGDIYMYWKQYDLAISNYKSAMAEKPNNSQYLKLGKAYLMDKQYEASKNTLEPLVKTNKLDSKQKLEACELLGDAFMKLNNVKMAITYYKDALAETEKNGGNGFIDINTKLAEAYTKQGDTKLASNYISNSINRANNTTDKSELFKAQEKAADFLNSNSLFDQEIDVRKDNLQRAKELGQKGYLNTDSISFGRMNYKIATAYIAKNNYDDAIPYLQKSIEEASKKKDIVVEKDATRKLSEVYRTVGDYRKALESYQSYVQLVDTLYRRKEQQISQSTRFRNDIAAKQERITSLEKERTLQKSRMELAYKNQELTVESNRRQQITIYSLIFGMLLFALMAYFFFRSNRQQKLTNNLLALRSLRSQMNPHFIFNALNSVNHYIATNDERSANRFLSQFSALMRSVLENSEEDVIPFSKEIELLQLYTKLEHSRFTEKFDFEFSIDDSISMDEYLIPPMLLQPYVENAIWHGLRYRETKGLLRVEIKKEGEDKIQIVIVDNGIGRKQSAALKTDHQKKQKSKAMENIKKRIAILNSMYKDKVEVRVEDMEMPETGTRVIVTLNKD